MSQAVFWKKFSILPQLGNSLEIDGLDSQTARAYAVPSKT